MLNTSYRHSLQHSNFDAHPEYRVSSSQTVLLVMIGAEYAAQGVHVSCVYTDFSYWHTGRKFDLPVYTTREIYVKAMRLLNLSGYTKRVRNLAVSVYALIPSRSEQLELFGSRSHAVTAAMDKINDTYGEFVITPALMMGMDETILDRIASPQEAH
jgi:hypothetical protein